VKYFAGRKSRVAGNLIAYGMRTLNIIFRAYRDYHPLRFFWAIAAFCFLIGSSLAVFLLAHYLTFGRFSPHLWSGFTGGFFTVVGLVFFVVGILADMLDRQRNNQERLLYLLKRSVQNGNLDGFCRAGRVVPTGRDHP